MAPLESWRSEWNGKQMEEMDDCGDFGGYADGLVEAGDSYENSLVGNAVSGILLLADSDRFWGRADAGAD